MYRTRTTDVVGMALLPAMLAVAGCRGPSRDENGSDEGWVGTTVNEDSTRVVRSLGGSVWKADGRLVEEAAIGTETRGEDDLLGEVYGIDATSDRIFILDHVFGTVRVYDWAGNHVRNIGRHGQGPGEFGSVSDLGIDPVREHLVVREGIGILHRFTLSGEFVSRTSPRFRYSVSGPEFLLRVTRDGLAMMPQYTYRRVPGGTPPLVQEHFLYTIQPDGSFTDSLELPIESDQPYVLKAWVQPDTYRPEPVPFAPQFVWTIGWDGSYISGLADEYRFEIRYPDGGRTVIEREAEPVAVEGAEKEAAIRRIYGIMRDFVPGWAWDGPEVPDTKPWFSAIIPDRAGRLWVLREGKGRPVPNWIEPEDWRDWDHNPEWVSAFEFDVFDQATGQYLGRVEAPAGLVADPEPVIDGETFICLTEDRSGRPIVRRYRLEFPSEKPLHRTIVPE
jgi:hypothetical protein